MFLSIYLSIYQLCYPLQNFSYLSIYHFFRLFVSIYLSIYVSISVYFYLSIYLSFTSYVSIYLSIYLLINVYMCKMKRYLYWGELYKFILVTMLRLNLVGYVIRTCKTGQWTAAWTVAWCYKRWDEAYFPWGPFMCFIESFEGSNRPFPMHNISSFADCREEDTVHCCTHKTKD